MRKMEQRRVEIQEWVRRVRADEHSDLPDEREEIGRCSIHPDVLQVRRLQGQPDAPESLWTCSGCQQLKREREDRARQAQERAYEDSLYDVEPKLSDRAAEAVQKWTLRQTGPQPGSPEEESALARMDLAREDAIAKDKETPAQRRRRHRRHWARHYNVSWR